MMFIFSQRKYIADLFVEWAKSNNAAIEPINVITWLYTKNLLNEENVTKLLEKEKMENPFARRYVAYFKKYYLYPDGRKYQDNAHFCISSLETDAIKRPFENDNIVVEELKVTERLTGKVIYQGTSYDKYSKVIRGLDNE